MNLVTKENAPVGELLKDLRDETRDLVRQEIELARVETRQKIRAALRQVAWMGIGLVLLLVGFIELVAALDRGLTAWLVEGMQLQIAVWLAPLILAVIFLAVGAILAKKGMNSLKEDTTPEHTVHSLQKTRDWAKHRAERRTT